MDYEVKKTVYGWWVIQLKVFGHSGSDNLPILPLEYRGRYNSKRSADNALNRYYAGR